MIDYRINTVNDKNNFTWINDNSRVIDTYRSQFDALYDRIIEELRYKPIVEHKCNNCGAPLKMDINNHLFKCKYCGTAYLIGTKQINS